MVVLYPKTMKNRNTDIDFCRGIAIIMMIIYHWYCLLDLRYKNNDNNTHKKHIEKPHINFLGHFSRAVFIFLMGFSISLSHKKNHNDFFNRHLCRSSYLAFYAMIITVTTRVILKNSYIRFGILHYMSVVMLFIAFLAEYPTLVLLIGIILYMTYIIIQDKRSSNTFEAIIGYKPHFNTLDLFPISKWVLLSSLGYYVGSEFVDYKKFNKNSIIPKNFITNPITFLGKYSLEIYLLHWVVIYYIQKLLITK